jgi:hypothetical protein
MDAATAVISTAMPAWVVRFGRIEGEPEGLVDLGVVFARQQR